MMESKRVSFDIFCLDVFLFLSALSENICYFDIKINHLLVISLINTVCSRR